MLRRRVAAVLVPFVALGSLGFLARDLTAVQAGPVGYAVDGGRGTVVRVDPRGNPEGVTSAPVTG